MNAEQLSILGDIIELRDRATAAEAERDRLREEVAWLRSMLATRPDSGEGE